VFEGSRSLNSKRRTEGGYSATPNQKKGAYNVKNTLLLSILAFAAVPGAFAQPAPGADVSTAIPIYYGQFASDIGDVNTAPLHVYSVTLAKGQQFSAALSIAATSPGATTQLLLFSPDTKSLANVRYGTGVGGNLVNSGGCSGHACSLALAVVPAAGTYYVTVTTSDVGVSYTLQVTTMGTPQRQTLPAQAGCLTGQVDYLTYSLQLIALNLPDTISVGGTQACATCSVKPPLYSQITEKLETALRSGLPVSACYDAMGNIFQISLQHP
jgi:hypothetical protein